MRQTDLYRSGKPPELLSRNCFELLVKSITVFVTLLASRFLGWVQRLRWSTQSRLRMPGSSWLLCNGVLRHELPDQQVLDHRIIASNGLIAPRVTMSCQLLRRAACRSVLPRERFSPLTQSGHDSSPPRRAKVVRLFACYSAKIGRPQRRKQGWLGPIKCKRTCFRPQQKCCRLELR